MRVNAGESLGGSEVGDFEDAAVGVHQHVVPLDVPVHYFVLVLWVLLGGVEMRGSIGVGGVGCGV